MRPTCVPDSGGAVNVFPLGAIVSCTKASGGYLKLHTNGLYDECRQPVGGVKGVMVTIKSFAGYGSNMTLCSHFKGLYDGGSKRLPSPEQYLDLALIVPKGRPVLPREHVFQLLPPHEGSSGLAQETPWTAVGRGSAIHDAGGLVKGLARSVRTQVGPDGPVDTSDLHYQGTGTQRVGTPKLLKVRCQGDTYSLRDETRKETGRSGQDVGGIAVEGIGAVRERSCGELTSSEKKRERHRMVREEVAEETLRMKRMRGKSEAGMGGDEGDVGERASGKRPSKKKGATASSKARRPDSLTIREGQAMGGGDSAHPGVEAAREPSGKSKRKVVCDIPAWERYYNHRSLSRKTVDEIKAAMQSKFLYEKGKIWTKNPSVLAPIYKPVTRSPEKDDRVHKDVFKPEDKDKYYYYPVNGQHTMVAVKELEGEPMFNLWKMHSWPARVVWFSDQDFAGYRQCLADMIDVEKLSILDDILALRGVFLQSATRHLKRQHKPGIKDMVATRKVDRVILRMFHYILFLETEEDERVWRPGSPFFRTEGRLMEDFGPQGLTKQVWVEMRKHFQGAVEYVNTCKRTLPHEKESLDDAKRLYEDDSFLKGMARLSVHHIRIGKWVHNAQKHATVREGNMLVEECDRLYVIFSGEKLEDNTFAVYPASSPTKASRAHGPSPAKHTVATRSKAVCSSDPSGQAVVCFDVAKEDMFSRSMWENGGVTSSRGAAYGEMERNPSHLIGLLENFCKAGQTVFFFGKAHASVVWELLHTGRNVVALEKEAKMIDYLHEFVKARVEDTRNACEFVQTTGERNWDPKRDMYWKLSGNKRTEVWDFLFEPGPPGATDLEYSRGRNLVFSVLNGYHDAPRESVSHFLRRLEHVYLTLAELLTLENSKSQFDEEDPFDTEDVEELSDSETFDFESMPLPRVVGQVGDEEEGGPRRYSTSPGGLKRVFRREPVDDQLSDDGEEERDYDHEPCDRLPVDHDTWGNDRLYFFGKHHRFTSEDVWGHNVIWHPRIFQPGVENGMWVMAMKEADGKWSGMKRLGAGAFKRMARKTPVEHLSLMNPGRSNADVAAYAVQKLNELYANNMLEFRATFYTLETASSRGIDWRMPQPPSGGQHPRGGGGGDEGDGGGGGGDGSQFAGKGTGETSSVEKASGGKGPGGKDSGGKGSGRKGSGGKGSGGKGSGGKGSGGKDSGGKRRTSESPQYMETDPHCVGGASVDTDSEDVKGLDARALVIGTSEKVLHSRSAVARTREGILEGGQWTFVHAPGLGDNEGEEEPAVEARVHGDEKGGELVVEGGEVTVSIQTDPQWKDDDSSPTRCGEEQQGGRASVLSTTRGMVLHEAMELGDDSTATELVSDSGVAEMQNLQSSVEGGEVAVSIKMDPERKDHDSLSSRCGAEQGDRATVLSTGREIVLHEAIDLPSDSAATEIVSDTAVAKCRTSNRPWTLPQWCDKRASSLEGLPSTV
ncbi:hypothetical protein CBR_g30534 [Chara braunii]|uniref:Uncharacterized protein n=1 Tax=Chara braunii TaxID=69332 RepID=A0A388LCZ9_CHABU|nr:hypothetical protein CBR_g30534 [Chara braunii]|eukprot:GBG80168.1 hypothetical protein CBR_g30534 [Chara braunii]